MASAVDLAVVVIASGDSAVIVGAAPGLGVPPMDQTVEAIDGGSADEEAWESWRAGRYEMVGVVARFPALATN